MFFGFWLFGCEDLFSGDDINESEFDLFAAFVFLLVVLFFHWYLVFIGDLLPLLVAFFLDFLQQQSVLIIPRKPILKEVFLQSFLNIYVSHFIKDSLRLLILGLVKMLRKQPSKIYLIPRIQQPPRIDEQAIIVLDESWMAGDVDLAGELDLRVGRQLDFEDDAGLLQFLQEVLVVVDEGDALVAVLEVD